MNADKALNILTIMTRISFNKNFSSFHGFIEKRLGRPVLTMEFAYPKTLDEAKETITHEEMKELVEFIYYLMEGR